MNKHELGCRAADVIFMIEYSNADRGCSLSKQGDLIKILLRRWGNHGPHPRMRVGVVTYHNRAEQRISLDDYNNNMDKLIDAVTNITGYCSDGHNHGQSLRPSGRANLQVAFDFVRDHSFGRHHHRHGVSKVVIPIIHSELRGQWSAGVVDASDRLKATCTTIMPVLVHRDHQQQPELEIARNMASQPFQDFYTDFKNINDIGNTTMLGMYGSNCQLHFL